MYNLPPAAVQLCKCFLQLRAGLNLAEGQASEMREGERTGWGGGHEGLGRGMTRCGAADIGCSFISGGRWVTHGSNEVKTLYAENKDKVWVESGRVLMELVK